MSARVTSNQLFFLHFCFVLVLKPPENVIGERGHKIGRLGVTTEGTLPSRSGLPRVGNAASGLSTPALFDLYSPSLLLFSSLDFTALSVFWTPSITSVCRILLSQTSTFSLTSSFCQICRYMHFKLTKNAKTKLIHAVNIY